MKPLKHRLFKLSTLALGIALACHAHAGQSSTPVWTVETSAVSIQGDMGSITLDGHAFSFTDSAASPVQVAYFDSNPGSNSQAAIASFIQDSNLFGLSASKALSFGVSNDSIGAATTIAAPSTPYDYLAVHVGGGELLFHWAAPVTGAFQINGSNLSNYRAYSSATAVPEPSSYAMLMAGLGLAGLTAARRRRS